LARYGTALALYSYRRVLQFYTTNTIIIVVFVFVENLVLDCELCIG